ncbi:acid protease [Lophiostoma macrostomum CBS 122681]|uniref:Acid protease n=1 Tax=Lophiostoma macrostomum CBS 122681 TaxID=1314788 RepID=A0A6A6T3S8_9PLEO|nr:acid protease [Lophiostoma macrostomum CBS 122681]
MRTAASGVLVATLLQSADALALALEARDGPANSNATLPDPISVSFTQNWDGIDGSWNSLALRLGGPEQFTRAFVSTASQQTWAINPLACQYNDTDSSGQAVLKFDTTCFESRGRTFNLSASTSWNQQGYYQLWLEKSLNLSGNGLYGNDTVGIGQPGEEGPTLLNQTIGTLITDNFWLGLFGINPKPTNFSTFADPTPSYMTNLFEQKKIPSVAWGYTAGAQYRETTVLSSLTLGGYDTTRFVPNDLSFGFAPDNERDIVVGVVGIQTSSATKSNVDLLARDDFTMYIDSTVAELYLPIEVCEAFEKTFGLTYDDATHLYLVDDLLHEQLRADNATIEFSLGTKSADTIVNITLPYAALDMQAQPPYRGLQNATRYFPIRRAQNDTQFVLGRTFLQEAYLIVDWERQNFSVSQVDWVLGQDPNIVSITSPDYTHELDQKSKRSLSTGAIIGIAIGGGFLFAMAMCGIAWMYWRRRQKRKLETVKATYAAKAASKDAPAEQSDEVPTSPIKEEERTNVFPKAELPADSASRPELGVDVKDSSLLSSPTAEAMNTERPIYEMPGDMPVRQEAGGRQLSEKETMMVRERNINGVDPNGPLSVSPLSEEAPRRLEPISPSQVALVGRRLPNVSPTSPHTPRTPRDGSSLEASDTFFQQSPREARDGRFLEAEDSLLSPISPLDTPSESSRRRFSYEM